MTCQVPEGSLVLQTDIPGGAIDLEKFDGWIERKVSEFAPVDLTTDLSHLSDDQEQLLARLFQVSDIMDEIYWKQVFPDRDAAIASMTDEDEIRFFRINYGPWERLNGNLPFLPDYGPKPPGSGYYPPDMTIEEFEAIENDEKYSLYTLITRNPSGGLEVVPYHTAYSAEVGKAAALLREAAALAGNEGFRKYLELRAEALLTDDYLASDMAWMDMKGNDIDFVVGPIENYEDALFNYKAAHEAFILIRDPEWSQRLEHISALLPQMQKDLPVPEPFKKEVPGSGSDLGVYDVIYYAGDCNAGSKTIAINLPNDERVQAEKGSRKLQLKNAIRYKFQEILVPIGNVLIAEDQRDHVTFDAFFENTMYHEVAHGLGINQTISGKGTVREALKEQYSALEEGKADILGLFLITRMHEMGMMDERNLMDNYVTFMASIFRSIRFGVASSHGKANMIRFYYFQEQGAFSRDPATGTYRIDFEKMQEAMNLLATQILTIQGEGDYETARNLVGEKGYIRNELQVDLDRLRELSIPVDIVFNQGPVVAGLE
ncbi:MAG: Zn-dependent hydrolase [Bacteroidetes bacterium]|nr:MAG: Zn-dependent hydrolase [Bacteroidota bacterium]